MFYLLLPSNAFRPLFVIKIVDLDGMPPSSEQLILEHA